MHQCDGARLRRDAPAHGFDIEMPAVIVEERIWNKLHVVERGKEIKERIAWLRDQNFVAGIAEQTKNIAVGFTGAGGKNDLCWIDDGTVILIVTTHRFTRVEQPLGVRIVNESLGCG